MDPAVITAVATAVVTIIGAVAAATVLIIKALNRTDERVRDTKDQNEEIIKKTDEIHDLANSNLNRVTNELKNALKTIEKLKYPKLIQVVPARVIKDRRKK